MELVDLYDKNRHPLGKTTEKYTEFNKGEYQIIVHTCLFNKKGEMLIQKRSSDKIDWPNMWDISAGGGVISGEEPYQAAERELFEELGIKVSLQDERPFLTIHYPKVFDDYYFIDCDLEINKFVRQIEEVQAIKWASYSEIKEMQKNNEFIVYNDGFIELLFSMKNNRGSYPKKA